MRRVVVTGIGLVTPIGVGAEFVWKSLLAGKSGAGTISAFDASDLPVRYACEVPWTTGRGGGGEAIPGSFDPEIAMSSRERRRVDEFILYGVAAANEAIEDSGWVAQTEQQQERTGVMIGAGIGGLSTIAETALLLEKEGYRKVSPFFVPSALINLTSGHVSIKHGFRGPNHSVVTACATGAHAIGDAARIIKYGDADVMVAGGCEAAVCKIGIAGFAAARALSNGFNDDPMSASRPYDKDRDGFVLGEGAGIVVLEDYQHAKARGAKIYAEIAGYGMSGDAYHITAPAEDGNGGFRAMRSAIKDAGLTTSDIGYVNAHGTSTPLGDEIELRAVERLFGDDAAYLTLSSTKSAIGHLLGAAGSVEAIFSILALRDQIVPPTLNLHTPSVETKIDLVPLVAKELTFKAALSNSFGFGGTNAALVMKAV
ncbi:beta-ketoacyl-ACP synthase II [Candidatus Phycosocius spiralis]|uniref:3-oxoacyl-[acyl-carrier-protein] synthase 2 n=1 Tax=Candidatus Phycosocius spiralis TaxID=2815099 RepID=A0ABQ4PW30_9PROT|nr:beta-ketoacyl-ACP synthase II [Candidatus Phycosocius spiralis]GIU67256.1 3-oxoacyl-[acyl-carrier-protein] synthase 2 [Candidatus Phycosocius spiralis]